MVAMATTFPKVARTRLGYDTTEVERFLQSARQSFEDGGGLSSAAIRTHAFRMRRGGYATAAVDQALERLEDALAEREREVAVRRGGEKPWFRNTRGLAQEILARIERADGHRFTRVGVLRHGYSRRDVDRFSKRIRAYFKDGAELSVEQVRGVAFRRQRRGYQEAQVDALLDSVIEVMLAVR